MDDMHGMRRRFGARVKAHRQALGIRQDDLAVQVGMTRSTIANLETGRQNISLDLACRLAQIFGTTVGYLLGEEGRDAKPPGPQVPPDVVRGIGDVRRAAARLDRLLAIYRVRGS